MEHRRSRLEDLPPLALRELRELVLDAPPDEGRSPHVASASGVVRRGDFVYVIGDDLLSLAVFRLSLTEPGRVRRVLPGELPRAGGDGKRTKPDLEVLTVLPPFGEAPYGALMGLGSGSGEGRDRGFVWPLDPDGDLRGDPHVVDLAPLYGRLAEEIDHLNVEGACVMGEQLWLLHRGEHSHTRNVIAELSLDAVMQSLRADRSLEPDELVRVRDYDLGDLGGVPVTFSDATPLAGELLVFTASAEAQGGEAADGAIRGSVVGTIDVEGEVRRLRTIDRRYKVEGVHASVDIGVVDFLFVCDQDDPGTPSPLLSGSMPLDPQVETGTSQSAHHSGR